MFQVMRIDITSLTCADSIRNTVDTAVRVKYAPANVKQLLVTTSNNKLLKFDAWNGQILAEVSYNCLYIVESYYLPLVYQY